MTMERLHLAPGFMSYNSMLAAEHVARYAFAAALCSGRRVLDVACGEGYGSAMLSAAGAARVVGVDISAEAVSLARARFGRTGVEFRTDDAGALPQVLSAEAPFDLIVSFATIEHLDDVRPFLDGLRAVLAPGGSILISAPNESDAGAASANPFHRRGYTLASFRAATEAVLGPADGLWFGMPVQGFGILRADSPLCGTDHDGLEAILHGEPAGTTHLLPAQRGHRVDAGGASFFIATWGVPATPTIAAAPIAFEAWVGTWRALEWLRAENARLLRELAAARTGAMPVKHEASERIADFQRAALLDAERLEAARAALAQTEVELARITAERCAQSRRKPERLDSAAELARMCAVLAEREADLAAIRASRSWRLLRAYARLYETPVAGPPLRALRRTAGRMARAFRSG